MAARKDPKPKRTSGPSGPSGKHVKSEVKLRADEDEIEIWTRAAEAGDMDRNSFLRRAANELAKRILGER